MKDSPQSRTRDSVMSAPGYAKERDILLLTVRISLYFLNSSSKQQNENVANWASFVISLCGTKAASYAKKSARATTSCVFFSSRNNF